MFQVKITNLYLYLRLNHEVLTIQILPYVRIRPPKLILLMDISHGSPDGKCNSNDLRNVLSIQDTRRVSTFCNSVQEISWSVWDPKSPSVQISTAPGNRVARKNWRKNLDFSTQFCFCSLLIPNNLNWMSSFLFLHSWASGLNYIKHFTSINSFIKYFYLRS